MTSTSRRRLISVTLALCGGLSTLATPAFAGKLEALIGPPSTGQGGSNPVSLPPTNLLDWQVSYVNEQQREWMVSVIPGVFYGQRWSADNLYIGFGGGMLISTNGLGLGVYQSIGAETEPFWETVRLKAEYRQVIGVTAVGSEFPYTLRIGVSYEF